MGRLMGAPIVYRWDGEHMTPLPRFEREANATFVVGATYGLAPVEQRSTKSHAHYFATVSEAWATLPEHMAERFPTPDSLRKYALCKAGFADATQFVASSRAEAVRIAAFVSPGADFVTVNDKIVTRFQAHSQSYASMGRQAFYESKAKVLEILADMLGVAPEALAHHAEREAA